MGEKERNGRSIVVVVLIGDVTFQRCVTKLIHFHFSTIVAGFHARIYKNKTRNRFDFDTKSNESNNERMIESIADGSTTLCIHGIN